MFKMLDNRRLVAMAAAALAVLSLVWFIARTQKNNSTPDDFFDVEHGSEIETSAAVLDVTRVPWTEEDIDGNAAGTGKAFRYSISSVVGSFDPAFANTESENTIAYHIYEGLYRMVDGELVPAGAVGVDISEDGLTYIFHINDKAKWSDGRRVKAEDYAYGIRRLMDPETDSPAAYRGDIIKNGKAVRKGELELSELGVRSSDDNTLVIELERPSESFLYILQSGVFSPVRRDYAEVYGDTFCKSSGRQVYNGPFLLHSTAEKTIVLEKNPEYWNADNVKLDRVVIKTAVDGDLATRLYHEGTLDYARIPSALAKYEPDAVFYMEGAVDFIIPNLDNRFLANRNLRLAISYAMDRKALSDISGSEAFLRFVPPYVNGVDGGTYGRSFPYEAVPATGDEELARRYLHAALSELSCRAKEIRLRAVTVDSGLCQAEALAFVEQIQRVLGIKVDLVTVSYGVRNEMMRSHSEDFDLLFTGWMPDYPDAASFLEMFASDSSMNVSNYSNRAYDDLLAKAGSSAGAERLGALFEAEKTLMDDGAVFAFKLRSIQYLLNSEHRHLAHYWAGHTLEYIFDDIG
jgi:oligopeptide transport system substrate-binding protein